MAPHARRTPPPPIKKFVLIILDCFHVLRSSPLNNFKSKGKYFHPSPWWRGGGGGIFNVPKNISGSAAPGIHHFIDLARPGNTFTVVRG